MEKEIELDCFKSSELYFRPLKNTKNVFAQTHGIKMGDSFLFFTPFTRTLVNISSIQLKIKNDFDKYKMKGKVGKTLDLTFYADGEIRATIWKGGIVK